MKLDALLDKCRARLTQHVAIGFDGRAYAGPDLIAQEVVSLLGASRPGSFEKPVVDPGMISILDGSNDPQPAYQFTPGEARWFAAELLRAADEAEDLAAAKGPVS